MRSGSDSLAKTVFSVAEVENTVLYWVIISYTTDCTRSYAHKSLGRSAAACSRPMFVIAFVNSSHLPHRVPQLRLEFPWRQCCRSCPRVETFAFGKHPRAFTSQEDEFGKKMPPSVPLPTPQELKRKKCNLKTWSKQSPNTCFKHGHNFPGLVQFRRSPGRLVFFFTCGSTPLIRMVMQEQNQSLWHFTQSNIVFYILQHFCFPFRNKLEKSLFANQMHFNTITKDGRQLLLVQHCTHHAVFAILVL